MLNSLVVSPQLGVPITILTFALVKGNLLLAYFSYLAVYCAFIRNWIFYSLHLLMNSWYCSVAWLIGWALILEYTIGGSTVARGISPNLVFTLWLIDIFPCLHLILRFKLVSSVYLDKTDGSRLASCTFIVLFLEEWCYIVLLNWSLVLLHADPFFS